MCATTHNLLNKLPYRGLCRLVCTLSCSQSWAQLVFQWIESIGRRWPILLKSASFSTSTPFYVFHDPERNDWKTYFERSISLKNFNQQTRLTQICLFSSIKMGLQNPFNICCRFISSVHRGYQISKRPRWKIGLSKVEVTLPEIYTIGICYIHESLSLIQCHHECASIRIATILCVRTYYTSKNYTIESYRVLLLPIFFHVKVIVKRSSQKTILWSSLLLVVSYNFLMQMNIINFLETNLSCF